MTRARSHQSLCSRSTPLSRADGVEQVRDEATHPPGLGDDQVEEAVLGGGIPARRRSGSGSTRSPWIAVSGVRSSWLTRERNARWWSWDRRSASASWSHAVEGVTLDRQPHRRRGPSKRSNESPEMRWGPFHQATSAGAHPSGTGSGVPTVSAPTGPGRSSCGGPSRIERAAALEEPSRREAPRRRSSGVRSMPARRSRPSRRRGRRGRSAAPVRRRAPAPRPPARGAGPAALSPCRPARARVRPASRARRGASRGSGCAG